VASYIRIRIRKKKRGDIRFELTPQKGRKKGGKAGSALSAKTFKLHSLPSFSLYTTQLESQFQWNNLLFL
jgi:hypothetical protein